jgi:hypothetical protein
MPAISIMPPCTPEWWKDNKDQGPILTCTKFVACASPYGPYGYGDTAEAAFHDVIRLLHEEINENTRAYSFNEKGQNTGVLEFVPQKYFPISEFSR